jgi:hypothetical protein
VLKSKYISAVAREFEVLRSRLQNGCQSKQQRPAANKKLTDAQELAGCLYLGHLDAIEASARHSILLDCANSVLRRYRDPEPTDESTGSFTLGPTVGKHWAERLLERHPQYIYESLSSESGSLCLSTSIRSGARLTTRRTTIDTTYYSIPQETCRSLEN